MPITFSRFTVCQKVHLVGGGSWMQALVVTFLGIHCIPSWETNNLHLIYDRVHRVCLFGRQKGQGEIGCNVKQLNHFRIELLLHKWQGCSYVPGVVMQRVPDGGLFWMWSQCTWQSPSPLGGLGDASPKFWKLKLHRKDFQAFIKVLFSVVCWLL